MHATYPQPNVSESKQTGWFDTRRRSPVSPAQQESARESPEGEEQASGSDRQLPDRLPLPRAARESATGTSTGKEVSDTGPLAASGGNLSTSVASVNVLGLASADALKSTTSGSGTSSQSQSSVASLSLLGGLVAADVVKSNTSATCSNGQAAVTGNAELVGLVAAGQSILVSNPNLAISLPGGISLIVNEQTSSPSGTSGSITVNALHVKGPSIDIVVASAQSGIICSVIIQ